MKVTFPWVAGIQAVLRHGARLAGLAEVVLAGDGNDVVLVDGNGPVSRSELATAVAAHRPESASLVVVEGHHDRSTVVALLSAGLAGADVMVAHPGTAIAAPTDGPPGRGRVWLGTTGTTGAPRQSARRRYGVGLARPVHHLWRSWLRHRPGPLLVLPGLDHGYGLGLTLAGLLLRRTVILPPRGEPAALADLVARWSPSMAVAVPVQLLWLTPLSDWSPRVLLTGSSPLSVEVQQQVTQRFGAVLHNLYGSTEAGFSTMATPVDLARRPGCVGRPLPGVGVRIRDGAVQSHSPFATHPDPWVPTGDHGHWEDDLLVLDGRVDRVAVVHGLNIDLGEVHAALAAHPQVDTVTVDVVPDPVSGQQVVARVRVLGAVTGHDLEAWTRRTVGPRVTVTVSVQ